MNTTFLVIKHVFRKLIFCFLIINFQYTVYGYNHNLKKLNFVYIYKQMKKVRYLKHNFSGEKIKKLLKTYSSIRSLDIDLISDIVLRMHRIEVETKYRIKKKIAFGGEKVVFEATDGNNNTVALALFVESKYRLKNFNNEIEFSKKLHHSNIIEIIDYNYDIFFYTQPLADMDLFTFMGNVDLSSNTYLSLLISLGIARAILYLSENNIVHRDIKPENVLLFKNVDGTFTPKIIDFSFAIDLENYDFDSESSPRCTVAYLAPDCLQVFLKNRKNFNLKSIPINDIYSFGVLLYELFYMKSMNLILTNKFKLFSKFKKKFKLNTSLLEFIGDLLHHDFRPNLDCDDYLYVGLGDRVESVNSLISNCWKTTFSDRLKINEIIYILKDLLSDFFDDDVVF